MIWSDGVTPNIINKNNPNMNIDNGLYFVLRIDLLKEIK